MPNVPSDNQGAKHARAKLTDDQIPLIRASTKKPAEIAVEFDISVSSVHLIRARKRWKHIL